jgi:uncharacterized protein
VGTAQYPVQDPDWLVTDFAERVRHVAHAVVVSADGFVLAVSATLPRGHADRLAAVTSGLAGLADGAACTFGVGEVIQTAVEMEAGLPVTMPAGHGSTLAVLAAAECDLGLISCEMSLLTERAGRELTPATRQEYDPGSLLPAVPLQVGGRKATDHRPQGPLDLALGGDRRASPFCHPARFRCEEQLLYRPRLGLSACQVPTHQLGCARTLGTPGRSVKFASRCRADVDGDRGVWCRLVSVSALSSLAT